MYICIYAYYIYIYVCILYIYIYIYIYVSKGSKQIIRQFRRTNQKACFDHVAATCARLLAYFQAFRLVLAAPGVTGLNQTECRVFLARAPRVVGAGLERPIPDGDATQAAARSRTTHFGSQIRKGRSPLLHCSRLGRQHGCKAAGEPHGMPGPLQLGRTSNVSGGQLQVAYQTVTACIFCLLSWLITQAATSLQWLPCTLQKTLNIHCIV